jgi:type VI secretion system protein ImpA
VAASDLSVAGDVDEGVPPAPAPASLETSPLAMVPAVTPPTDLPPEEGSPPQEDAPQQDTPPPSPAQPKVVSTPETAPNVAEPPPVIALDPPIVALCEPISESDPFGPDLDFDGDGDYLNFLASAEGILPSSFFSPEDGKPFDRTTVDLAGQIAGIDALLRRSRDLRLLVMRARLHILNRDLGGFAVTLATLAEWLDRFWEGVHPRPQGGDVAARTAALAALDLPTVVFPLQYAPLFEARRIGVVTYRASMIAAGEVKPRTGEQRHTANALAEAMSDADPTVLAASRRHVATLRASLGRIRNTFALQGSASGLETLPALVEKILAFVDPLVASREQAASRVETDDTSKSSGATIGAGPASLAQAKDALAAIADYYSRLEPSSPTLPLVRQAYQLIGKSFIEVMSILVPTQMDKAAFQIGADQVFELPVGRLSKQPEGASLASGDGAHPSEGAGSPAYKVQSRADALALLEQVQRFFRRAEPSSPVPILCERARGLAERDFMGVLRDVLPKAALKNAGADK